MDAVLNRVSSPTFVGRADELAALEGALGRAAAGVPAFAFVAGESGVGKSRLVAEFESRAREAGARVLDRPLPRARRRGDPLRPAGRGAAPDRARARPGASRCLRPPPARRWPSCSPASATAPARGPSTEGTRPSGAGLRGAARPAGSPRRRAAGRARARGPPLGRPVDARLPDLPRAQRPLRSRCASSSPTAPTSCTGAIPLRPLLAELERTCGRRAARAGALQPRARSASRCRRSSTSPAPAELADDVFERSEGNALYAEELLAASAQGCSDIPDTLRDLLLHRVERLPAAAQEVVPRGRRSSTRCATRCWPRSRELRGRRAARAGSARRSRTRCWSPRERRQLRVPARAGGRGRVRRPAAGRAQRAAPAARRGAGARPRAAGAARRRRRGRACSPATGTPPTTSRGRWPPR